MMPARKSWLSSARLAQALLACQLPTTSPPQGWTPQEPWLLPHPKPSRPDAANMQIDSNILRLMPTASRGGGLSTSNFRHTGDAIGPQDPAGDCRVS
jgi:hypothetical protein